MDNSAVGSDNIRIELIKHLNTQFLKILLQFYKIVWKTSQLPENWKIAHIIPLLKPGKNRLETDSYRQISLTSYTS